MVVGGVCREQPALQGGAVREVGVAGAVVGDSPCVARLRRKDQSVKQEG